MSHCTDTVTAGGPRPRRCPPWSPPSGSSTANRQAVEDVAPEGARRAWTQPSARPSRPRRGWPRSDSGLARLLEAMADALDEERDALVGLADRETALGRPRGRREQPHDLPAALLRGRVIRTGRVSRSSSMGRTTRRWGRSRTVRRLLVPVGPIAMFRGVELPVPAFSVAGGDTAAAIAAGCPVVAKAHSSAPRAVGVAVHAALVGAVGGAARPRGRHRPRLRPRSRRGARPPPGKRAVAPFTGSTAGRRSLLFIA